MEWHAFAIRIPKRKDRIRAIEVLMEVREVRHAFPGNVWLVMKPHIEALKQADIPFEEVTDSPAEDENKKAEGNRKKKQPKRRSSS